MTPKPAPQWLDRYPLLDASHTDDLEAAAAVHELQHGLPREAAEAKAHADYTRVQAVEAAAHHLLGIRAAHASGHDTAARQHGELYAATMRHAGHDPFAPPPKEVLDQVENLKPKVYGFRAHAADELFVPEERAADHDDARLREALDRVLALRAQVK